MPKNKMVTKPCPECQQQVPVACKACPCGHVFFAARRAISVHKTGGQKSGEEEGVEGEGEVKRRRTERVRRERPNYFGTTQIENRIKTLKRKSKQRTGNSTSSSTNDMEGDGSNGEDVMNSAANTTANKKRGRPPKNANKVDKVDKQTAEKEEDLLANISTEKSLQLAIILAEINRKMSAQQFKVM